MINKIIFKKIRFNNLKPKNFNKYIIKKGLFVFPAGPALASIERSRHYYDSILMADLVFFDSGFFVLLLKIFKNIGSNFEDYFELVEDIATINQLSEIATVPSIS